MTRSDRNKLDFALVQACVGGDRQAWCDLILQVETTVYFAVRDGLRLRGRNPSQDQVEELQADVFFSLVRRDFAKLRRYRGRSSLTYWMKVVTGNFVIDYLRKKRPTVSLDDPDAASHWEDLQDGCPNPEEALVSQEARAMVRDLWSELGAEDRRFVELFYERDLDFDDVAERMNTSVGAIYSRKNRVRNKLTRILERRENLSKLRSRCVWNDDGRLR
jgi:RNA polymerase sigma-70 factor (ECF subfamily)